MAPEFRIGGLKGEAAQRLVDELERIRQEQGALRASAVVAEATPPTSPLHPAFEWSDKRAGVQYRLIQARQLIRQVEIIDRADDKPWVRYYAHVATPTEREGDYMPVFELVHQRTRWQAALLEAQRDLAAAHRRVDELLDAARNDGLSESQIAVITLATAALTNASVALGRLRDVA